jgi:hypothetical protein
MSMYNLIDELYYNIINEYKKFFTKHNVDNEAFFTISCDVLSLLIATIIVTMTTESTPESVIFGIIDDIAKSSKDRIQSRINNLKTRSSIQ